MASHPLEKWRKRHRIARFRLARDSLIPYSTLKDVERGKDPRISTVRRIIRYTAQYQDALAWEDFC